MKSNHAISMKYFRVQSRISNEISKKYFRVQSEVEMKYCGVRDEISACPKRDCSSTREERGRVQNVCGDERETKWQVGRSEGRSERHTNGQASW